MLLFGHDRHEQHRHGLLPAFLAALSQASTAIFDAYAELEHHVRSFRGQYTHANSDDGRDDFRNELLDARIATRLALKLHEIAPLGVAARQSTDVAAVGDPKLAGAMRFMRERAAAGANVGDVLRSVPMARTALERKFKAAFGVAPHEHMRKLRIERVQELLVSTGLTVGEIAEATGFEHPEYLSAMFRRECGVSPREYRAGLRSKELKVAGAKVRPIKRSDTNRP